jgi:hypothetical protein
VAFRVVQTQLTGRLLFTLQFLVMLGIYEAFEESQIDGNGVQENLFQ